MSKEKVKQLEEEQSGLESFLVKAKQRKADWQRKLRERKQALEEAILNDDGVYRRNNKVQAAETAVNTWSRKVAETQEELKQVKHKLLEARYPESRQETLEARREARQRIAQIEERLVDTIKGCYEEAWQVQSEANSLVSEHNQLAGSVGAQTLPKMKRMNGLSADRFVEGILRAAIHEGDL